jgi:hypothetical protein
MSMRFFLTASLTVVAALAIVKAIPDGDGTALAQAGTSSLACRAGETYINVMHGTDDMFSTAGTPDPLPTPSPQWATLSPPVNPATNIFDYTHVNYQFRDTLSYTLNPGDTVTAGRVTTRIRSNGDINSNDVLSFRQQGATSGSFAPFGYPAPNGNALVTYNLAAMAAPASPTNLLPALTANHFLDVAMEDDSSVDFMRLELCVEPAPKPYDLQINKRQDGNLYLINVTNPGRAITAPAKVEVTEVVPAGLTVNAIGFSGPGWSCVPAAPVVGPDAIVCTYMLSSGTLASGANLPVIELKTSGKPMCPNCARVRLYVQRRIIPYPEQDAELRTIIGPITPLPLPGTWVLVTEPNTRNNLSCVPLR